ncbi:hypothetical protein [Flavobacterium sp. NKUCC04_CG]|uniref:hypothetical protein n=1 Tax=Flavobacterium sp. NKUCC04_CG TaxID=2842121 RepID=UPI001C5AEA67|nr:hypothetical protein [Flavobacterium sp. NKUCC04_CG]MBW3519765.1 hypothetical protein [Flavobacterium sp. NKUCC04_CG]
MKKLLYLAGFLLGMAACNKEDVEQDAFSYRTLEVFSSTEVNNTKIGDAKVLSTWQELESFAGKEVADFYKRNSGIINFDEQQVILSKMMFYREPLVTQTLVLNGRQLNYSLEIGKGKNSIPAGVFWVGVVYQKLKKLELKAKIEILEPSITPYGYWVLEKIADLNTLEMRLPKDGNGMPTDQPYYRLKLEESGKLEGKNLTNTLNGNFELYRPLHLIDIDESRLVTTEVFEPILGDGYLYHEKLAGSLLYTVEDGKLYLFYDNATKCFIFKRFEI